RETDHEPAADEARNLDELAPAHRCPLGDGGLTHELRQIRIHFHRIDLAAHASLPVFSTWPAATWIAFLIRLYVPHRQRCRAIAPSISASLGFGARSSSATALMICPAWQ